MRSFIVPINNGYWFVTVYVIICTCLPAINPFLKGISRNQYFLLLLFFFCFEYLAAPFSGSAYANISRGFFFYVLGGFFKLFVLKPETKSVRKAILFLLLAFVFIFAETVGYYFSFLEPASRVRSLLSFCVIKTSILVSSACFFIAFYNFEIKCFRGINIVAASTFGVYLLHENVFARHLFWDILFDVLHKQLPSDYYMPLAFGTICCVFACCLIIDMILQKILLKPILKKIQSIWK